MTGAAGRMALVVAGLLLVLTYLLLRGATPDTALHERRLDALNALILNQAALHRDVLKARAGSLRNYDPLVSGVDALRRAAKALQGAARMSAEVDRERKSLAAEVDAQEALVERFKSNNALLQNSLAYFAHVSHRLGALTSDDSPAVAAAVGALGNAMLGLLGDPSEAAAADLAVALDRLAGLQVPRSLQEDSQGLVAHGRLILAVVPAVDDILARLFATRTTERARVMQDLFIDAFRRAESRAWTYRVLLYGASVLLLAYLSHLYLRLRANVRALAERSSALQARSEFEHLIAGISAQFIDLPHDRIGAGISQGLERLGQHAEVERAYIVLFGADGATAADVYSWHREGAAAPDGWLDAVPALESGWTLEGNEHRGCIDVPSTMALPQSPERAVLEQRAIRSWLCVPLWHAGRRIGLLGFDAVRREKRWPDDDIALLRMAGEIFANALERERAEREKETLEGRLRQAQRMEAIGTLAGGIAHDFNNILGAILGYAEMALARLRRGSLPWQHVQEVRKAGERARGIVDQILTFSRRAEHARRPVRMQPLLEEAVGLLRAALPATIEIRVSIQAEDAVVLGESTEIQQVVMNLCTNAAQAMEAHGTVEALVVAVATAAERVLSHGTLAAGNYVRLVVKDTGYGMD
ncbi:MAG: DAHL domain-containing protein, partial [Geminicoccaceae bacterium]